MLTVEHKIQKMIAMGMLALLLCGATTHAATGEGVSDDFVINNRDAILVLATNNWNGTVTVGWTNAGEVRLIRQEKNYPENKKEWNVSRGFLWTTFKDRYELVELKKEYIYIVQRLDGSELGRTTQTVRPDIVVVLVRGYSFPFFEGVVLDSWESNEEEVALGLVANVSEWFGQKNITCWDASGVLNGRKSVDWNAGRLSGLINQQRTGDYATARIHLIGYSMGGLTSRKYAHDNPSTVNKIFTIQTPHTGTHLADFLRRSDLADLDDEPTSNLKPESLEKFNQDYPPNVPLYVFYSNNHRQVLDSKLLRGAHSIMLGFDATKAMIGWPIFQLPPFRSDGAVPEISGHGAIMRRRLWEKDYTVQYDIDRRSITGSMQTSLDHFSAHKHPATLDKIVEWLGYPQVLGFSEQVMLPMGENDPEELSPLYYIDGFEGQIDSDNPVSKTVVIGNASMAYFMATTSDPENCMFTLTTPSLETIDPDTVDSLVSYYNEDGVMQYEIEQPLAGEWVMNLTTTVLPPDIVEFGMFASEDARILFGLSASQEWVNTGQAVVLIAEIADDNNGGITGADVTAEITLPDGTKTVVTLHDDGANGDDVAGDGIYCYLFEETSQEGRYEIHAKATGTWGGAAFERATSANFTATHADISISGVLAEQGVDTDNNGLFNLLRIRVPINVQTEKEYRLTAFVFDADDEQIKRINSGKLYMEPLEDNLTGDFYSDGKVDMLDFSILASWWLSSDCGPENDWCGGTDINQSNDVGLTELASFLDNWLKGTKPPSIEFEISADTISRLNASGPYQIRSIEISDADTGYVITSTDDYTTAAYAVSNFEPLDSDGDGLSDWEEIHIYGTDPFNPDTDGDGVSDGDEVLIYGTDPLNPDTDGDGMPDGYEIAYGLNPMVDDRDEDLDGDGLTNWEEYLLGTRPDKIDTDGDGRNDKWEIENSTNPLVYDEFVWVPADINRDGAVDVLDLILMAKQWLSEPGYASADIAPPGGDGIINLLDFAYMAELWLLASE